LACLLDTNVAIHLRDGDETILARFEALDRRSFLSVVSRVELEGGVYARPELVYIRRAAVNNILAMIETLEFDGRAADLYGEIVAAAGFSRRKMIDRMIAATALQHDMVLITCNPADFRDIPGLAIEEW
jgi:tRNA(fMet)-specific endonuclease VapC